MAMTEKWVETKDGSKIRTYPSSLDKNAKAAPNPRVEQAVKGIDKKRWNEERKRRSNSKSK